MNRLTRRRLLALATAGGSLGLAGCGGLPAIEPSSRTRSTTARTPESHQTAPPTNTRSTDDGSLLESPDEATPADETASPGDTPVKDTGNQRAAIFLYEDVLEAITKRVQSNRQPWYTAYLQLRDDAEDAKHAEPKSVVENGAPASTDDRHKFGTDAPYQGKDGVFSDDINRGDYFAALDMGNWIRTLAMSYGFSGRDEYARKAIDFLHHWFIDSETRMFPSARNFGAHTMGLEPQNSIEQYITIPKMLYGATYVRGHPYWSTKSTAAESKLVDWVRAYLKDSESGGHRGGPVGNDIYKWWVVNRAVAAAFLRDTDALSRCFEDWRTTAFKDFEARGTFEFARWRTRGLYYSFSALNALTTTAEIARHFGVDLYNHEVGGTNRLRVALEFHAPYLSSPGDWPWQELGGLEPFERQFGGVAYELAYSHWGEETFYDAVRAAGRPVFDQRVLGWTTLTHGNLFEIDA